MLDMCASPVLDYLLKSVEKPHPMAADTAICCFYHHHIK